jgi:phosphoglycolate phosphatase-like HAD superfamily hydrolase
LVDGVLVPVPQEIFRALDTFQDSNWNSILRPDLATLRPDGSPAKIALSLGLVLGEGFLTISAKDAVEMQNLGRTAIRLARALGIEDSILRRQKSVLDSVELQDWTAVRKEWSNVSEDLKAAMIEIKSESLSQLISLGGWLRGLEALSALASSRYSTATAQLLRQPEMLGYFADVVGKMGDKLGEDQSVIATRDGISRLQPLITGKRGTAPSEHDAREIREVSKTLMDALCAEKKYP